MNDEQKPLMTQAEAAEYLDVSVRTLSRWRDAGEGPRYVTVSGRAWYTMPLLEEWLAGGQEAGA